MRLFFTFLCGLLSVIYSFGQGCFPNGLPIASQAQIDSFAINYPNCTEIIGHLNIIGNTFPITNLSGLNQITAARSLTVWDTYLNDLSGLENISGHLEFIDILNNPNLLNLNSLSGIESVSVLFIAENYSLYDISGLANVDSDSLDSVAGIHIGGNINLSACSIESICNYLSDGFNPIFYENAQDCNSNEEILFGCADVSRVKNLSFYDGNQNKVQDANEPYYSDILVTLTPGDIDMIGSPTTHYIQPGNYIATYSETDNANWLLTTDSSSYSLLVDLGEEVTFAFGIYPLQLVSQLTSFITSPNARCNEDVIFDISVRNTGTTLASGTMWLQIDDNVTQTNFITGPPDFPVGDFLNFVSFADYTDANGTHTSQVFRYDAEVRCSFDPNDKLVNPTRAYDEVLFDEDFIYTVRFQNTGNDVAYDVKILDTLDTNLDWSTFRVLGSSHSEVLSTNLSDEGVITFDFKNIFLPDSTSNLEGSNGHVTYMISALDGIDENTVIRNSAGIYFDQNPPVLTNTTVNVMVSMLTFTTTPNDLFPDLIIRPNPNTGTFQVEGIPRGTYNLLNTKGQIIQSGQLENNTSIDISETAQGVYFIQMVIDEQMVTQRVVKL